MTRDPLAVLLGLALTGLIAGAALWILLRYQKGPASPVVRGYPPERFPDQDLARSGPLASLAETQARLLAASAQLSAHSAGAVWLRVFLGELRQLMDAAYRAAGIARLYGDSSRIESVAREVGAIEARFAERLLQSALRGEGTLDEAEMDTRLALLRSFARELERP